MNADPEQGLEAELWRLWRLAAFSVPEGKAGEWRVKRSVVTAEEAEENRRQAEMFGGDRHTPVGYYTALLKGDECWMADSLDEMRDHLECFAQCKQRGGRVLILGFGLGLITYSVLQLPNVEHVDVLELDEDVIELCYRRPWRAQYAGDRLTVHHGDAFEYSWPDDARWSVVWADIWQPMQEQNLAEMARLRRIYRPRCEWFGAWGEDWLLASRRRRLGADPLTGVDVSAHARYLETQHAELGELLQPEALDRIEQAERAFEKRVLGLD